MLITLKAEWSLSRNDSGFSFCLRKNYMSYNEKYIAHLVERPAIREAEGSNPSMLFCFSQFLQTL